MTQSTEPLSAPYALRYTYTRSTGPVIGRFFESLSVGVLEGVRTVDGRVLCPPLEYDEAGRATTREFVTLRPFGTVVTASWVASPRSSHPLHEPFAWVLVQIDGADNRMLHVVPAPKASSVKRGMRVRLRFVPELQRTGTMHDIACFEVVSPTIPGSVNLQYTVEPGRHQSAFLQGLSRGELIGGSDPVSGKVYIPPRQADPVTGNPTSEYVRVSDAGVLVSFTVVRIPFEGQRLTPPYCFGAIVLDGCDIPLYHLVSGVPESEIRMGMRVRAKWKERSEWAASLENIAYFAPTGEPDAPFESYKEHL